MFTCDPSLTDQDLYHDVVDPCALP